MFYYYYYYNTYNYIGLFITKCTQVVINIIKHLDMVNLLLL